MAGVREHSRLPVPGFPAAIFPVLVLVGAGRVSVDLFVQLGGAVDLAVGRVLDVLHAWRLVVLEAAVKRKQPRSKTIRRHYSTPSCTINSEKRKRVERWTLHALDGRSKRGEELPSVDAW